VPLSPCYTVCKLTSPLHTLDVTSLPSFRFI
jgi:hypothetical protein